MELKVYDGEVFERNKKWYVIFAFVILLVVVLSVLSSNEIGGVIVLFFAGGYLYFLGKNEKIKMIIGKKALQIGKVTIPWDKLSGFVLEYHTEKKKIHNIVILDDKKYSKIYTINDSVKNLENFVNELNDYLPMLDKYDQSFFDKFIRKIKL